MADESGQDPYRVEDARLTALEERLQQARADEAARTGRGDGTAQPKGYAQGNRVVAALIGSLLGSALIGWLIDRWFETSPWGLLVMIFLGIFVAFRQIYVISKERPE